MSRLIRWVDRLNNVLLFLIAVMSILMTVVVAYQVIIRFLLSGFNIKISAPWTEELARYLMIWSIFLGTAYATRKSGLISIEILDLFLPKLPIKVIKVISIIISIIFYSVILAIGYNWVVFGLSENSTVMGISMLFVYSALPLSAVVMIINSLTLLLEMFMNTQNENNKSVDLL